MEGLKERKRLIDGRRDASKFGDDREFVQF